MSTSIYISEKLSVKCFKQKNDFFANSMRPNPVEVTFRGSKAILPLNYAFHHPDSDLMQL